MQRLGRAGRAGNHVQSSGAGAAQILVRQIEQALVVGVGVDRGHRAAVDAESIVQNFGDRSEAVRGAGSVRNDVVLGWIVGLVVYAENERGVGPVGGRGDDDLLHGPAEMLLGVNALGEEAGGLDDDLSADRGPINFAGILHLENLEALPFHRDGVIGVGDAVRQVA